MSANLCSFFQGDSDASWITISLHRLQLQLLHYISYSIVFDEKPPPQDALLTTVLVALLTATAQSSLVSGRLVHEAAACLQSQLVDHVRNVGAALLDVVVGGVKSALTMKVNEQLLRGLVRGVAAGFEMFKHCKADEQVRLLRALDPEPTLADPLESYSRLLAMSRSSEAARGNWLLTSTYANNLLKVAFCALRNLGRAKNEDSSDNNEECLRVLHACVVGDGAVVSLSSLLKQARRKPRSACKLVNSMLDGEALAGVLRTAAMDAIGELVESVENFTAGKLAVLRGLASEVLSAVKSKVATAAAAVDKSSAVMASSVAKTVLAKTSKVLDLLISVQQLVQLFEKSIEKAQSHAKALTVALVSLQTFWDLFRIEDPGEIAKAAQALYKDAPLGEEEKKTAGKIIPGLGVAEVLQALERGIPIKDGHKCTFGTPGKVAVLLELAKHHLATVTDMLSLLNTAFSGPAQKSAGLNETVIGLQALVA
jgi:hypothetical protein